MKLLFTFDKRTCHFTKNSLSGSQFIFTTLLSARSILSTPMKLRDRYPHLRNPAVVKALVVQSVYASMALENQIVPVERLEALYTLTKPAAPVKPAAEAAR